MYGKLINDLIKQCIKEKNGALLHNTNTCILIYADGILLISSNDYQLQKLFDICWKYGEMWRIKFNPLKSNIIEFGIQFFDNSKFYLNKRIIPKVDMLKYLGAYLNKNLGFDTLASDKF